MGEKLTIDKYAFEPTEDITALELALIAKSFGPYGYFPGPMNHISTASGETIDPRIAKHFRFVGSVERL